MAISLPTDDILCHQYNIALSACYSWSIATAKMSFAVLYIRLLPKALLININKAMVIFLACQTLEESLITILQCRPVHSAWKVGVEGTCLDLRILWWSTVSYQSFCILDTKEAN
jgi:hypothetical protein